MPMTAPAPRAASHVALTQHSAWVARYLHLLAPGSWILDFACGSGRHTRLALAGGHRVLAVDRDPSVLNGLQGTQADVREEDLENERWSFAAERFDAVICTNYLHRPRLDLLAGLLRAGGLLVYETFALGNERYGRPSNPEFLLRPGELVALAARAGLHLLAYEDGLVERPLARVQRACAVRPPFDPASIALGPGAGRGTLE
jgi:SAM-dependent methyltransferase